MFKRITLAGLVALSFVGASSPSFAALPFGSNLVTNGDAEADAGSTNGDEIGPVTGFTSTGQFTVVTYGAPGGFPLAGDPGPALRGSNFFAGGPSAAESTGSQTIDVSAGAAVIDLGGASFDLSAWLGGFASQSDHAVLSLDFLGASNASLGSAELGPVTRTDRGDATGLLFRDLLGLVPAGTRTIDLTLTLTRNDGSYDDGYADNLSLVLTGGNPTAVPEPVNALLLLSGIGALAVVLRRRGVRASR